MSILETMLGVGGDFLDVASTVNDFGEASRTSNFMRAGLDLKDAAKLGETPLSGPLDWLAPLGLATGIHQLVTGETWQDKTEGGLDAAAGAAGVLELFGLEAAGPVGMVIGAGATGFSVGTKGNEIQRKWGIGGENEDGEHKSLSDSWGEIAFNPMTAQHAGPALLAAGGMAVVNTLADPFLDLAGVEPPISSKQQREMNGSSKVTFDALSASGMSEDAAVNLASLSNPEFRENRERQHSHAALVKSGLPLSVAHMLTGVMT
jgi:hypothetical protein